MMTMTGRMTTIEVVTGLHSIYPGNGGEENLSPVKDVV